MKSIFAKLTLLSAIIVCGILLHTSTVEAALPAGTVGTPPDPTGINTEGPVRNAWKSSFLKFLLDNGYTQSDRDSVLGLIFSKNLVGQATCWSGDLRGFTGRDRLEPEACARLFFTDTGIAFTNEAGAAAGIIKFKPKDLREDITPPPESTSESCKKNPPAVVTTNDIRGINASSQSSQQDALNKIVPYLTCNGIPYAKSVEFGRKIVGTKDEEDRVSLWLNTISSISESKKTGEDVVTVAELKNEQQHVASTVTTDDPELCAITSGCGIRWLLASIGNILLWLVGWLLWLSARLFDFALQISVVNIHEILNMGFIYVAWSVARDLANACFIFILLYIAIGTILQTTNVNIEKAVVNIVVAALFINFSLVGVRAVIDAGNILTLYFYNNIAQDPNVRNHGISGQIVGALEFQRGFTTIGSSLQNAQQDGSPTGAPEDVGEGSSIPGFVRNPRVDWPTLITQTIGGVVVILITSFMFLAAGIMLILRLVNIIKLMIMSPIAFVSFAFPGYESEGKKWWKEVTNEAFWPLAYMVFLSIVLVVIRAIGQGGGLSNLLSPSWTANIIGSIIYFILIIGFMSEALIQAKKMGARGADGAVKRLDKFKGDLQSWAGRKTYGRVAATVANNQAIRNWAASRVPGGKLLMKSLDSAGAGYVKAAEEQAAEHTKFKARLDVDTRTGQKVDANRRRGDRYESNVGRLGRNRILNSEGSRRFNDARAGSTRDRVKLTARMRLQVTHRRENIEDQQRIIADTTGTYNDQEKNRARNEERRLIQQAQMDWLGFDGDTGFLRQDAQIRGEYGAMGLGGFITANP